MFAQMRQMAVQSVLHLAVVLVVPGCAARLLLINSVAQLAPTTMVVKQPWMAVLFVMVGLAIILLPLPSVAANAPTTMVAKQL
jgi:hypothetical protein